MAALALAAGGCQLFLGLEDGEPIPNDDAALASLAVSRGALEPPFDPDITEYTVRLPLGAEDLEITPTPAVPEGVSVTIDEIALAPGSPSLAVALALGDNRIEIAVVPEDGEGRTYVVTARRGAGILQQEYLKSSTPRTGARFGVSVAIDGDTLVVGASGESSGATGVGGDQSDESAPLSGAAYVFVRSGASWVQEAYLKASNTDADDSFGRSLALDGDTLVVGAPLEVSDGSIPQNNSTPQAGAAYVFVRSGSTWSQQAYLKASNAAPNDLFGSAVAIDGDTIAIAAPAEDSGAIGPGGGPAEQDDNSAAGAGAVYVFTRSGASWSQQSYIKASNTEGNDRFGDAVALDGQTLVVGAPGEDSAATGTGGGDQADNSAPNAGAVYVFTRDGASWSQQAYLKASNAEAGDLFGFAVDIHGDTVVVGAREESSAATGPASGAEGQRDNSAASAGAVYAFTREGASWSQQAYLKASNTNENDRFGTTVALEGDILVVGAPDEDGGSTGVDGDQADNSSPTSGAAYVLTRRGDEWSQQAYLKASNTNVDDLFASEVGIAGDLIVAGARLEDSAAAGVGAGAAEQNDNSAINAGAVYVFQ